ncbi:hypothetical protein EJB05_45381, partial [Eragrostis curvula]
LRDLDYSQTIIDSWLQSPILSCLQELELDALCHGHRCRYFEPLCPCNRPRGLLQKILASTFRFSSTLIVATISSCQILDGTVETLQFPQLKQLGLHHVQISEVSMTRLMASCPVIECVLLTDIWGPLSKISLRINSLSLKNIGFSSAFDKIIIENAPSLERLIQVGSKCSVAPHVLAISAPKLEIIGSLSDHYTQYGIGPTIIEVVQMQAFTMVAGNVKILAIHNFRLSLDMVICLIQSFACLEKLYIQTSNVPDGKNLWRHKHRDLIKHLNIRLKTIVLKKYRGVKSQASFATFFILNAKMLEFMVFEGRPYDDMRKFLAEQKKLLQLEKRASRGAQFHYTTTGCEHYFPHIKHVRDLSRADPFQCTC